MYVCQVSGLRVGHYSMTLEAGGLRLSSGQTITNVHCCCYHVTVARVCCLKLKLKCFCSYLLFCLNYLPENAIHGLNNKLL